MQLIEKFQEFNKYYTQMKEEGANCFTMYMPADPIQKYILDEFIAERGLKYEFMDAEDPGFAEMYVAADYPSSNQGVN